MLTRAGLERHAGRAARSPRADACAVRMSEQGIAVRVEGIRRPERADLLASASTINRRSSSDGVFRSEPEFRESLQQDTEHILGVSVPDGSVRAQLQAVQLVLLEVAVVRENMHPSAEFARKWLAIAQGGRALRCPADVADHELTGERAVLDVAHARTVACGQRLPHQLHVTLGIVRNAPPVLVRARAPAVTRELVQREMDVRRGAARQREEFAHCR